MTLVDDIKKFKERKILVIGEAIIDKYIFGYADRISPDAPVQNIKIENTINYLGGMGLVIQYIQSLGGIPQICTIIGIDYEGDQFIRKIKELKLNTSGILIDDTITTPQITRIKSMNQHVLRLETDYSNTIPKFSAKNFFKIIETGPQDIEAILILDYGLGGLFQDYFIQQLLRKLKKKYENIPIIARPHTSNYYLYEDIDLIRINLQKALNILSIKCYNETSTVIVGKKILNASKCKNVLLNYLESESYLFFKNFEKVEKIPTTLKSPVRSYVAVGSVIMAILGLSYASKIPVSDGTKIALFAAALTSSLPPVKFYNSDELREYISSYLNSQ